MTLHNHSKLCPVVAIRSEPGLSQTAALAASKNIPLTAIALFEVLPVEWEAPAIDGFDGLLIGSANAIRHGGTQLKKMTDLPVLAVGSKTAQAARQAGFSVAHVGQGGLQSVLDHHAARGKKLLRLSGKEHVSLQVHPGQEIVEIITYDSRAIAAPAALSDCLAQGGVVLLHSAAAAVHFSAECQRLGLGRSHIALAVLGPRIAEALGGGWADIQIADAPNDASLLDTAKLLALALSKNICQ